MSLKLRVLGLGLLAVLATSAFAAMNAAAKDQPKTHFVSAASHTDIIGTDAFGTENQLVFHPENEGAGITCTHATYHGTASSETTQAIQVRPEYKNCATTSGTWGSITVDVPAGCGTNVYEFTSGNPGTIHVNCKITITHPNCTIVVPEQTLDGATYTTATTSGVHSLKVDINTKVTSHYEGGICIFLGTTHTSTMTGSAAVSGLGAESKPVGITHT